MRLLSKLVFALAAVAVLVTGIWVYRSRRRPG